MEGAQIMEITEYITKQGDTWDIIAYRVYGRENLAHKIIQANFDLMVMIGEGRESVAARKIILFPAGVKVICPVLDLTEYNDSLPIWKRQGGA